MENKGTVSVIVTCYNHEKYIKQCIESIFEQTEQNIELLVINDGSKDASADIIENLLQDSPFAKSEFIDQGNLGVCITRNKGLEWAQGEYLLFVDSDNYLSKTYIQDLKEAAITQSADILYGNLVDVASGEVFVEGKNFDLQELLRGNFIDNCSLIRRSVIEDVRYDVELNRKKLVDYDFLLNLIIKHGAKAFYVPKANLNYRILDDSLSRQVDHGSDRFYYEVYLYIMMKHVGTLPNKVAKALQHHIFLLEGRLSELVVHLGKVDNYVYELQDTVHFLENQKEDLETTYKNVMTKFSRERLNYRAEIQEMEQASASWQYKFEQKNIELAMVMNSKAYRFGKLAMWPFSITKRIVRNPKILVQKMKTTSGKVKRRLGRLPNPKIVIVQQKRKKARRNNPSEVHHNLLIYVIYENQQRLQEYKLYFLEKCAELVAEVLIVVNGDLPKSDIERLQKFGKVELRENQGYDTAAFRYGIQSIGKEKLQDYEELLLVNDTNVGPITDLRPLVNKMRKNGEIDFWGISYGEEQADITNCNPYGYIPLHLQTYFLGIKQSLLQYDGFFDYWENLTDTNSRLKAVGKHETVFTKYFADRGFRHTAVTNQNQDSAMYIHPLEMVKAGVPLVKFSAFKNDTSDKYLWQGLERESEVPALLDYIRNETSFPAAILTDVLETIRNSEQSKYVLLIDGVENIIPQCTRYRVENKAEQLRQQNIPVCVKNLSELSVADGEYASSVIIYRAGGTPVLNQLIALCKKFNKPLIYDIDDLVIDTYYTDQLEYTQNLDAVGKANYDANVQSYGLVLRNCDAAITTTKRLKTELSKYVSDVFLNRNVASKELVTISNEALLSKTSHPQVKIAYFSGSITHNENFELIKKDLLSILDKYPQTELHLVGYLTLPDDLNKFKQQIVQHDYVDWHQLPGLIAEMDINLAPLVDSIFNEAKSEIKWIEASLVSVPTIASDLGAFSEMIEDGVTGLLAKDGEWFEKLEMLVSSPDYCKKIAEGARQHVLEACTTAATADELIEYIQ